MTPERYQLIDQIFQAALELDPERRPAFLEDACSGDGTLRDEVESLLTSDRSGLSYLDEPAVKVAGKILAIDEPELSPGTHIDRYEILSLLGSGGMGEVYLAHDEKLNRKIALKLLPSDFTTNQERLRRFQQEARAASALNHPNIITIHEIGEVDNRHFIATEFVEGQTLRQRLRESRFRISEALEVAIQICSALSAAHHAGIVHRDIKPENIMLRRDGYVKILDFGLAKLTNEREPAINPRSDVRSDVSSGLVMGTLRYMSPEQAQCSPVDSRSDIFSLGVVIYEMLTGNPPFAGKTSGDLIASITTAQPRPLRHQLPEAPDELQKIIEKSLHKQKEARYQSVDGLLADLRRLSQQLNSVGMARLIVPIKQHKAISTLAAALVVLALAGASFALVRIFRGRHIPFQSVVMTRLTNYGDAWNPGISPDGNWVVYVRGEGLDKPSAKHSVCVRRVGDPTETEIVAPTEGQFGAVGFLPDGKSIYYRLKLPNQPVTTTVVPLSGGPATKLPFTSYGMSYSADGQHIAFIDNNLPEGKTSLIVANADGTNERKIVTRQVPSHFWAGVAPAWAPDGKKVACVAQSEGFTRLVEIGLQAGSERPITSQNWFDIRAAAWLPDGNGLLIAAAEETSPMMQIWHISYPNGEARRITSSTMNSFALSLSADGTTFATDTTSAPTSIWVLPVTSQSGSVPFVDMANGRQIAITNFIGFTNFRYLRLNAAQGRILYVSQESGNADIWSMNSDGSDRQQLTTDPHSDTWPVLSPDGRSIVFMSDRASTENIWRMDIDGGNQTRLTSERSERYPVFTPDGKFILYNSSTSGKETIWKMPVDGGQSTQVISDLSLRGVVSPDGKLLAYYNETKIVVVPIDGGMPIRTFDGDNTKLAWSPDGRALTYLVNRDFVLNLWMQPLDGGEAKQLTNFSSHGVSSYAWSGDGKQLVVARTTFHSDIVLINEGR